jgi:hypothetical protein
MKKMLVQLGIVVSAIASIAPSVNAQSIANGDYSDVYAGSYVIQVRNNKFRVAIDEPGPLDPWKFVSKAGFKPIKSGVFYDPSNQTYYCNDSMHKKKRTPARCTRNGWR